jgi:hypothetical protein
VPADRRHILHSLAGGLHDDSGTTVEDLGDGPQLVFGLSTKKRELLSQTVSTVRVVDRRLPPRALEDIIAVDRLQSTGEDDGDFVEEDYDEDDDEEEEEVADEGTVIYLERKHGDTGNEKKVVATTILATVGRLLGLALADDAAADQPSSEARLANAVLGFLTTVATVAMWDADETDFPERKRHWAAWRGKAFDEEPNYGEVDLDDEEDQAQSDSWGPAEEEREVLWVLRERSRWPRC